MRTPAPFVSLARAARDSGVTPMTSITATDGFRGKMAHRFSAFLTATGLGRTLMSRTLICRVVGCAASLALVAATAAAQGGLTKEKQGKGGSVVKGAAGTEGSVGDNGL